MAYFQKNCFLLNILLVLLCIVVEVSSRGPHYTPPTVPALTDQFTPISSITQEFSESFGHQNVHLLNNGSNVDLLLDKNSGSGLTSKNKYHYGFFSAAIKLPAGFTSGVVVAFYLSNADVYPHSHDEIDFELLGHEKRRDWVLQTNIYANGSVKTGREEKLYLWFDPTLQFHHYSILWNSHHIVFLVDNVPIREFPYKAAMASVYPSKPMSVHLTIWDASEWATHGGKYPVNYNYAPFKASFKQMEIQGCVSNATDPSSSSSSSSLCSKRSLSSLDPVDGEQFVKLSDQQAQGLEWSRRKLMFYSYCKDTVRYKVLPPECK